MAYIKTSELRSDGISVIVHVQKLENNVWSNTYTDTKYDKWSNDDFITDLDNQDKEFIELVNKYNSKYKIKPEDDTKIEEAYKKMMDDGNKFNDFKISEIRDKFKDERLLYFKRFIIYNT